MYHFSAAFLLIINRFACIEVEAVVAAHLTKQRKKIGLGELPLFVAGNIEVHPATMHGDQAIAEGGGLLHRVGDHDGG